jgi:beta-glucosidase
LVFVSFLSPPRFPDDGNADSEKAYTTFSYSELSITKAIPQCPSPPTPLKQTQNSLYAFLPHTISTTVTNTGLEAGAEVAQLYLSLTQTGVEFPPWQLRGFKKVMLQPGESKTVEFRLRKKDVSYWDVKTQEWRTVADGIVGVKVANSSRAVGWAGRLILDD